MSEGNDYEGIVILGVPRSGTTLLRRLLNAHPHIACPPETNLLNAAARFLAEDKFAGGLSIGVVPGLDFSGFSEDMVLERLREFLFNFLREIASRSGKARWAEKTAVDIFHLDQIERLFGERCRYVCVVRHPMDVVCSMKELSDKMGMYMHELHGYVQRYPAPLEAFSHAWADANRRLLRFNADHPDASIRFRYEDIATDPMGALERLFDFLGEPADVRALLDAALAPTESVGLGDWKTYQTRTISNASVGRYATLDKWTLTRLAPIVDPLMNELGYDLIAPEGPRSEAETRRLLELGRRVASMKLSSATTQHKDEP